MDPNRTANVGVLIRSQASKIQIHLDDTRFEGECEASDLASGYIATDCSKTLLSVSKVEADSKVSTVPRSLKWASRKTLKVSSVQWPFMAMKGAIFSSSGGDHLAFAWKTTQLVVGGDPLLMEMGDRTRLYK